MSYENLYLLEKIFAYKFGQTRYAQTFRYYSNAGFAPTAASYAAGPEMPAKSPLAPGPVTASPEPSSGKEMTLSQKEQALWTLIKRLRKCDFQENTRFFANDINYSFLFNGDRFDFTDTLYYATANYTSTGVLKGSFVTSDFLSQFMVKANAFDAYGRLGYGSSLISNTKQFFISFTVPSTMVQGDVIAIPVIAIYRPINQTDSPINAVL